MNPVSRSTHNPLLNPDLHPDSTEQTSPEELTTRQAFQKFVAGTFYTQMLKSLRSTENTVQYLDGGQAQQIFRNQLDQHIAEDLATNHGAVLSDSLYELFQQKLNSKLNQQQQPENSTKIDYLA